MPARTSLPWTWGCAACGVGGVGWTAANVTVPDHPALWPPILLSALALALSSLPGPVGGRALGTICGTIGVVLGYAQIALGSTLGFILSHM